MDENKFKELKNGVQEIIDFIASKNGREANNKLVDVSEELDELLDHTDDDEDLREISKYQVLLNQLQQRIVLLDGQV
jgi:CRISPR/Cas system CSM-associated protein Csm2 small subunit